MRTCNSFMNLICCFAPCLYKTVEILRNDLPAIYDSNHVLL